MSSRRKAREAVLKALYICESRGITANEAFAEMAAVDREMEDKALEPDIGVPDEWNSTHRDDLKPFALGISGKSLEYARALARSIEASREKLNGLIRPVLKNWDIERIARIDRIILWIALAEMGEKTEVRSQKIEEKKYIPLAVIINEAIELARKYSSNKSPAFVNGVLDAISRNLK